MNPFKTILSLTAAVFLCSLQNAAAIDLSKVTLNGYIDLEYTVADYGDTPNQNNGAFHQHHLSFLLDIPVNEQVSAYTHIEFDHGANTSVKNGGDIIVENAFIRYLVCDEVQLRFGKALTPFGYYNEIHDSTPAFISVFIPRTIYRVDERGGKPMFPKWNTGINVLGTVAMKATELDYVLYVGNGENATGTGSPATNEAEADDNKNKAYGARVNLQPNDHTQFGLSYFNGEKATGTLTIVNVPHSTMGVLFTTNTSSFNLLAEYAQSDVNGIKDVGAYGQVTYFLSKKFTPYYRYEYTDPNDHISTDTWTEQIIGLNIKPVNNLIFKIEASNNHRERNYTPAVPHADFNELRMAVALYF